MTQKLNNPPAFSRSAYAGSESPNTPYPHHEQDGMTLRDYFAAKSLAGMLSANAIFIKDKDAPAPKNMQPPPMRKMTDIEIATAAYQYADAMLKVRA